MIDRFWFESVYFREPGGILYELATLDGAGFAADEEPELLGRSLVLPPFPESERAGRAGLTPLPDPSISARSPHRRAWLTVAGASTGRSRLRPHPASPARAVDAAAAARHRRRRAASSDWGPRRRARRRRLSPRGKVLENGCLASSAAMPSAGSTLQPPGAPDRLAGSWPTARGLRARPEQVVAIGFSNGANIAASLLLRRPGVLRGAALLRAMLPYEPERLPDLTGTDVLIAAGEADPYSPPDQVGRLNRDPRCPGASVTTNVEPGAGHGRHAE